MIIINKMAFLEVYFLSIKHINSFNAARHFIKPREYLIFEMNVLILMDSRIYINSFIDLIA